MVWLREIQSEGEEGAEVPSALILILNDLHEMEASRQGVKPESTFIVLGKRGWGFLVVLIPLAMTEMIVICAISCVSGKQTRSCHLGHSGGKGATRMEILLETHVWAKAEVKNISSYFQKSELVDDFRRQRSLSSTGNGKDVILEACRSRR